MPAETILVPVGGVDATNIPDWVAAGAAGFGIGSSIYKPGDGVGDVTRKALALMRALGQDRGALIAARAGLASRFPAGPQ